MTDVALRDYLEALFTAEVKRLDQRVTDQEKAISASMISAKEAVAKAEGAIESRLSLLNEFHKAMGDQTATLMPREAAENRLKAIETRLDKAEGRGTGLNAGWGYLIAAAMFVVALIAVVIAATK